MTVPTTTISPFETEVEVGLAAVSAMFDDLLLTLDTWRAEVAGHHWDVAGAGHDALDEMIRSQVTPPLSAVDPMVVGAGFVATPGWLAAKPWYLSWWLRGSDDVPEIRRLTVELDPAADSFRDYTALEWWRVPAATGRPHITGPYVDYLCTSDYTLTLTAPVHCESRLVGMVGMDLYVKTVETVLLPRLRQVGRRATVVNGSGRVVVSTDPHRAAGMVLRLHGLREHLESGRAAGSLPGGQIIQECANTGVSLLWDRH